MLRSLLLLSAFVPVFDTACSWDSCGSYRSDGINVHLVSHSHDDVGWLKTADQYYYGGNRTIAPGAVKYTLDTVIAELIANPHRKFSQCESAFFWRWWNQQSDYRRHQVIRLAKTGQLEFINGGWVMNDEAAAHYTAIVDQMTLGLKFLNQTFGECGRPKVGWQIDPFGHSKEMANIFAQIGMEAFFFSRLHYNDHDKRAKEKTLNLVWQASQDLGKQSDIFTSVMYNGYGPPPGFCFDAYCDDELLQDDDRLENYNLERRFAAFTKWCEKQAASFRSNHIMLPMGSDFHYTNAKMWFENLDILIKYGQEQEAAGKSKLKLFYSTPTCYARAARAAAPSAFPVKSDDFFPYASDSQTYWAGYFTSRPALKAYVRTANNYLQMCKQLHANAQLGNTDIGHLEVFKRAMGIAQHHDAVSGTAKQHVTYDYEKQLSIGIMECEQIVNDALKKLPGQSQLRYSFCMHANESVCDVSQNNAKFSVTLFNPLGQAVTAPISIPVSKRYAKVTNHAGSVVSNQVESAFVPQTQLPYVRHPAPFSLHFFAYLPPLGFATYTVTSTNTPSKDRKKALRREKKLRELCEEKSAIDDPFGGTSITNDQITINFGSDGLMSNVVVAGVSLPVKQELLFYVGANSSKSRVSGAYIFRPNTTATHPVATAAVTVHKISGPLVEEVRQSFGPWATQVVRLTRGQPYIELEWTVGPLPNDTVGREVISRFSTPLASAGEFLTDSSGRQLITRRRNFAPTYAYNNSQPAAGNYYPVDSLIAIRDASRQLTILTDRAQGGSSLADGAVELMLHRRLFKDDDFGVAEPLDEPGVDGRGLVVRGRHWILLSKPADAAAAFRPLQRQLFSRPIAAFSKPVPQPQNWSGLGRALPLGVHLLTEEQWDGGMSGHMSVLLRFENIFQRHERPQPASFGLDGLFTQFDILFCDELKLGANQPKTTNTALRGKTVTLGPMQIATLECEIRAH